MAIGRRIKTEGGHKKGHSNMTHWNPTEVIKAETKKVRRQLDKLLSKEGRHDH